MEIGKSEVVVANEVSDPIFKTIHFHYYSQGESFFCTGGGAEGRSGANPITANFSQTKGNI